MSRTITEKSLVAKEIRKHLKAEGFTATVRSRKGDSINVTVTNPTPQQLQDIKIFVNRFESGHFDGMQDMYIYDNDSNLPQVKYIFVYAEFTDEYKQLALNALCDYFDIKPMTLEEMPDYINLTGREQPTAEAIWEVLAQSPRTSVTDFWDNIA